MPSIRVTSFAGMIPALEDKLLPNSNASYALNCRLDNGKLRAFKRYIQTEPTYTGDIAYDQKEDYIYNGPVESQYPTIFRPLTQNYFNYNLQQYPYNLYPRIFGVVNGVIRGVDYGSTRERYLGVPQGPTTLFNGQINANRSNLPQHRAYCATYVNSFGEESAPGIPTDAIEAHEGDQVNIIIAPSFTPGSPDTIDIRKIRLYRTLVEYETGEQLGNKNNTDFYLLQEFDYRPTFFTFNDVVTSDFMPADLLLSKEFFQPPIIDVIGIVELEELGFIAIAYRDGTIRLSERFQYHAYPTRNQITIPQRIDAIIAFYSTIYVTCFSGICYEIQVSLSPTGVKFDVEMYSDMYYSNGSRTLVRANFGAIFASQRGLMALNKKQQILISKELILSQQWKTEFSPAYGTWIPGYYMGINSPTNKSWLMDVPDEISGQTAFGKLTYIDDNLIPIFPEQIQPYSMVYGRGILVIRNGNRSYTWDGLEAEPTEYDAMVNFTWRSKLYVMPAPTTFAAAKVTLRNMHLRDAMSVPIRFRLYGDGVLRYEYSVRTDTPFRLPSLYKATNWMFELYGNSAEIHEVHIATSMDELSREPQ